MQCGYCPKAGIFLHMSTYYLTLFPHIGCRGELFLWNKLYLWNFNDLKDDYIPDANLQEYVSKFINMHEHPEWVNVLSTKENPFQEISASKVIDVQFILFTCIVGKGNMIKDQHYWSPSEHFSMSQLILNTDVTDFSFALKPIFSRIRKTLPIEPGVIYDDLSLAPRTPLNTQIDEKLFTSLKSAKRKNYKLWLKIRDSFEVLYVPLLNQSLVPLTVILMLIATSFETLLGGGRQTTKDQLDLLFKGSRKYKCKYQARDGQRYDDVPRTSFSIWYEHLYRDRNIVAHGNGLNNIIGRYFGQNHRYIAILIWIVCVKKILNKEMSFGLKGTILRQKINGKYWFTYQN